VIKYDFEMGDDGFYQVYQPKDKTKKPMYDIPGSKEYYKDLDFILTAIR
jgi:AMP deaminase